MSEDTATSNTATDAKGDGLEALMKENIVSRLASLPLISALYNFCASWYNHAKETHPHFNKAAGVLETVAAVAVGVVVGGTRPVLNYVVPRVSAVNSYVNQRLDRIEETLPCLHQQPTELYENSRNLTKTVVSSTVNTAKDAAFGAKDIITHRVAEAVDITKNITHDGVDLTKSVVTSAMNTAREAAFGATDLMTHRVADVVNLTKGTVQDSVDLTKSVVTSTASTAKDAAFGATDLMTHRVADLVNLTKGAVQDSVDLTKSVVTSTANTAKDAAFGATDLMTHRVADLVNLTKETVQDSVDLTKMLVTSTVNTAKDAAFGAKDIVASKMDDIINLTKGTIQDSMDLTKSVVTSTVGTALQAAQGTREVLAGRPYKPAESSHDQGTELITYLKQRVASGVDAVLEKSERAVDHFLPVTQEELEKLAAEVPGSNKAPAQDGPQSYSIRLGSLSTKVRHRAYMHSLNKLHLLKENTQNVLFHLQMIIDLVESMKQGVGQQFQEAQQKLHQVLSEWVQMQPGENQANEDTQTEVESRTLALLRLITQTLSPAYSRLMSSIEGLPSNVQERVDQAIGNVRHLHASFSSATSFRDLPSGILVQSREKIAKAREALDLLVEYVVQNTPLNWVVGPFRALPAAAKEVPVAETPGPGDPKRTEKEAPKEGGEAGTPGGALKETVTPPRPGKVVPEKAKMPEQARKAEAGKAKGGGKAQEVEATLEMQRRTAKKEVKQKEGEPEKKGKSSLNVPLEAPEKKP